MWRQVANENDAITSPIRFQETAMTNQRHSDVT